MATHRAETLSGPSCVSPDPGCGRSEAPERTTTNTEVHMKNKISAAGALDAMAVPTAAVEATGRMA